VNGPANLGTLGSRIAGDSGDAVTAGTARGLTAAQIQGTTEWDATQRQAANSLADTISGKTPSLAMLQLQEAKDRDRAEQLSIAAGARGVSTASARRTAAQKIAEIDQQADAQKAALRAQEVAAAQAQLGQLATAGRGQTLDVAKQQAALTQSAGQFTSEAANRRDEVNRQAVETATQAARERFAKGEITSTQLQTEIAKANADYQQQRTVLAAQQQLAASIASDDRLQTTLTKQAELQQAANAGDRDAQVELQKVQAQLTQDMEKFNATQLQNASAAEAENYLKALSLDDAYVASVRTAWLQAEQQGNQAALDALKIKVSLDIAQLSKSKDFWDKLQAVSGFLGGAGQAAGALATASDRRIKTAIEDVSATDIDEFLRALHYANQSWEYKEPEKWGHGRYVGPMAQDVGATKLGAGAVSESDGTLILDLRRMLGLALAALGRLDERVTELTRERL